MPPNWCDAARRERVAEPPRAGDVLRPDALVELDELGERMELEAASREEAVDEAVGVLDVGVARRRPAAREVVVVRLQLPGQRERARSRETARHAPISESATSIGSARALGSRRISRAARSISARLRAAVALSIQPDCDRALHRDARLQLRREASASALQEPSPRRGSRRRQPRSRQPPSCPATGYRRSPRCPGERLPRRRAARLLGRRRRALLQRACRVGAAFRPSSAPGAGLPATLPQRTITLPILMYHLIGPIRSGRAGDHAAADRRRPTTSPRRCAG